jgi:phosphoglucosamine mutase
MSLKAHWRLSHLVNDEQDHEKVDHRMKNLFGTDGIRGLANEYPITAEMSLKLGKTAVRMWCKDDGKESIVVGKDPRISGDMLAFALMSGICSMGVDAVYAGILPTPAIACLTVETGASAGVMISASHNPFYDNGIKFFNRKGYKLSSSDEREFENLFGSDNCAVSLKKGIHEIGRVHDLAEAETLYLNFLKKSFPDKFTLNGLKIVLDCSNGATYQVAPKLFRELGAALTPLSIAPDGKNINDRCGSQFTETLQAEVARSGSDLGFAFDGDGDRLIAVDEKGQTVTGDQILVICAGYLKQKGKLKNNRVISTVMSNLGLRVAFKKMGIDHSMTDVGDRQVMEKMIETGTILGGEDSGHMIFLNHHTTGDGILTALMLIQAMVHASQPLSELSKLMQVFPQTLVNIPVKQRADLNDVPGIQEAIREVEHELGEKGRVLVRYSGTRPLCRVMVEAPTDEQSKRYSGQIAEVISRHLG